MQIADLQPGRIVGTVTDINNDTIPDAIVVLDGSATTDQRRIATNENGYFELVDVKAGAPYRVSIHARDLQIGHHLPLFLNLDSAR